MQATNASTYSLQVGALGDAGSIGNIGVRAEIRTHIYHVNPPDTDAFWVGNHLENGAFIQFGYVLNSAGTYCDNGEVELGIPFTCSGVSHTVNGSEPLWSWTYLPNVARNGYYYGTASLTGENGTWHLYGIMPNSRGGWSFLLDGQQVANANFPSTSSSDKVSLVAEKITSSTTLGPLGPVEFRNLGYLKQDGWHLVTGLIAIVNCGLNASCIPFTYGVSSLGANHIITGTSVSQPKDGELLWSSAARSTQTTPIMSTTSTLTIVIAIMPELLFGGLAVAVLGILLVFEFVVRPRRKHTKRRGKLS